MKSLYQIAFSLALVFFSVNKGFAQENCAIVYGYDVSGNRISREFKCFTGRGPNDPITQPETSLISTLSPNPTTGVINVTFTEMLDAAHFVITDVGGIIVLQHTLSQPATAISFDLSAQIPGTYLLSIYTAGLDETYTIIKM